MSCLRGVLKAGLALAFLASAGVVSAGPGAEAPDGVGIYELSNGNFWLKNELVSGPADSVVTYGAGGAAYVQVVGDWNGDGVQGVGLYELATGSWFLRNTLTSGPAEISFAFGNFGNSNLIPISGNWTGEAGGDGVGLYDPATGAFFLRDTLDTGGIDREFGFAQPPPAGGYVPLAGQFGGVGQQDGVGVYDPSNGNFWLRATPDAGDATALRSSLTLAVSTTESSSAVVVVRSR